MVYIYIDLAVDHSLEVVTSIKKVSVDSLFQ